MNTIAWSQTAPWAETRQLEQDLTISRAIVELFSDPVLGNQLRFAVARHATKSISQPRCGIQRTSILFAPILFAPKLVCAEAGPIGPVLDRIRSALRYFREMCGYFYIRSRIAGIHAARKITNV
jgi:hypothetical protein